MAKSVTISFLGNLYFDTRTSNMFSSLKVKQYEPLFVGYDWFSEKPTLPQDKDISITNLKKQKPAILFYLRFAFHLFFTLLKTNTDIYIAADFFTLPITFFVAKLKGAKIFYDARDLYTQLPGAENKLFEKKIIKLVEGFCIKRVDHTFVTGKLDGEVLEKMYTVKNISLLRNLPLRKTSFSPVDLYTKYSIPPDKKILLYQGKIVKERGIEQYLSVMKTSDKFVFLFLGDGEHKEYYKEKIAALGIGGKIIFGGNIPQNELHRYTAGCYAGFALIANNSMNSYLALPNKLFEYIMVGLPVIVSNLPQMKQVVEQYKVGACIENNTVEEIIDILREWSNKPETYSEIQKNCIRAAQELHWENEFEKIEKLFDE